jgi:hypothetical protein
MYAPLLQSTSWNGTPGAGVRVKWDAGAANVYRWDYCGQYDVQVICEAVTASSAAPALPPTSTAAAALAPTSGLAVNLGYQVVDDARGLVMVGAGGTITAVTAAAVGGGPGAGGVADAGSMSPAGRVEVLRRISKRQLALVLRDLLACVTSVNAREVASLLMDRSLRGPTVSSSSGLEGPAAPAPHLALLEAGGTGFGAGAGSSSSSSSLSPSISSSSSGVAAMLELLEPSLGQHLFLPQYLRGYPEELKEAVGSLAAVEWGECVFGVCVCAGVMGGRVVWSVLNELLLVCKQSSLKCWPFTMLAFRCWRPFVLPSPPPRWRADHLPVASVRSGGGRGFDGDTGSRNPVTVAQKWVQRGLRTEHGPAVAQAIITEAVYNMVALRHPARLLPSGLVTLVRCSELQLSGTPHPGHLHLFSHVHLAAPACVPMN